MIVCEGQEKSTILFKSNQQKIALVKKLQERIDDLCITNKSKFLRKFFWELSKFLVFGVPLSTLLEREAPIDGIPFIVRTCVDYLRKRNN